MNNYLMLRSINSIIQELNDKRETFFIPSYQRGYRWTPRQVSDLLNDLWEFAKRPQKREEDIYCLQPVVVTRRSAECWEVIDGQQRLTTIRIILSFINNEVFRSSDDSFVIEYETRPGSQAFLNQIDKSRKEENIDYFHIVNAYETIEQWFKSKGNVRLTTTELLPVLLEHAKVIWYEVDNRINAIEIFTRINVGKIPLTNAELIKALFLSSDNFGGTQDLAHLRQLEISAEWDRMESVLRDPAFWYFLYDNKRPYVNRIELLFDFIAEKPGDGDDFFTFRHFDELFRKERNVETRWEEIKRTFLTFEEWFQDRTLYHLIGYLITTGTDLRKLREQALKIPKSSFKLHLEKLVKTPFKTAVADLGYGNPQTRMALLLFNIKTLLNNKESNARFPFDRYKKEKWDIEHIHAVQSEMPEKRQHQIEWLNEVAAFLAGKNDELKIRVESELVKLQNNQDVKFEKIYETVLNAYTEAEDDTDVNDISNLTLLDANTNRGYKNAVFPIKRQKIILKDENGTFIPPCTKNVFLKYYSDNIDQMSFYGRTDRSSYLDAIQTTLAEYFPPLVLEEHE